MTRMKGRGIDLGLGDDLIEADPRRATAVAVSTETEVARPDIKALFTGTALARDEQRLADLLQARSSIREQWGKASKAFVAIGRVLLSIEQLLSHDEHRRFREECARILPFSDSNASKFRQIARAIDARRLTEDQLPASFATAYELSTLDEVGLKLAAERQLIRPDVERTAVLAFKRDLKLGGMIVEGTVESSGESASRVSIAALRRDRDRIQREIDRIDDRRNVLVEQLAEAESRIAVAQGDK